MADRRPLLMLIDGPSLVYRGYFALPPLTMSDGLLVNAVFGFLQIVLRGMQDVKPDYAIVSFDLGKPQFRFDAYPEYKAGRPSMPDDLRAQFPIVREICQMLGMPVRELEGYEADDVIGTLAKKATAEGVDTMIVSGDLDGLQLVDDHVRLLTTRMGVASTVIYDEAKVMERYGLRPDQMLDYKALKGDTSDNIPGVPGVGEKTASSLLQQFGSLDASYERTAVRAAQIMGLRVAGVDMLEGNDGPLVMEVNSSPGLEGIESATGLDVAGAIIDHVGNQVAFPELDVRQRLSVSTGYGVAELLVREAGDFVGKTIGEAGLRDRDITVLTLHRDTDVIPNPRDTRKLEANDRLLCFGNLEEMRDMIPARRRRRARVRKLPEHPLPEPH